MTNANFSEVVVGPYPSYSMGPMESLLIVLLFLLWFYAIRRIYFVWSNVLNFSAIQTDSLTGRHTLGTKISGWDAFFQWAMDHLRNIRSSTGQNINDLEEPCQEALVMPESVASFQSRQDSGTVVITHVGSCGKITSDV